MSEEKKMTVEELYNYITSHINPEVALKRLLKSSLRTYEKLKFDSKEEAVDPLIVMTMAAMDMGWQFCVETNVEHVRGLLVGTQEYIDTIFPKKDEVTEDNNTTSHS